MTREEMMAEIAKHVIDTGRTQADAELIVQNIQSGDHPSE